MVKRKSKKQKKLSYIPQHRYVVQWNFKLSNFGKLKWRNHLYFRTKQDAKRQIKKEGGHSPHGIYKYRIRKRW